MESLNVNKLTKTIPALKDFGLSSACVFNGELRTVSDYEIPAELVAELEKLINA